MSDLIEALQIFLKYANSKYPTYCSHDTLHITEVELSAVSDEDVKRLDELGFFWDDNNECFISYRYGSA